MKSMLWSSITLYTNRYFHKALTLGRISRNLEKNSFIYKSNMFKTPIIEVLNDNYGFFYFSGVFDLCWFSTMSLIWNMFSLNALDYYKVKWQNIRNVDDGGSALMNALVHSIQFKFDFPFHLWPFASCWIQLMFSWVHQRCKWLPDYEMQVLYVTHYCYYYICYNLLMNGKLEMLQYYNV